MNTKKLLAMWMVLLILSLPIVYSLRISEVIGTGSLGFPYIIKGNDSVKIDIFIEDLFVGGEPVTPEMLITHGGVTIEGTQSHNVTDCQYVAGSTDRIICTRTLNINVPPALKLFDYYVKIGAVAVSPNNYLYTDATPPTDISFGIAQQGQNMGFTLSARDIVDFASASICSGLGKYEIAIQGANQSSKKAEGVFQGNCSESVAGNFSLSGVQDGLITVCAKVFDRMGANASSCTSLDVDSSPPQIGSLQLIATNGQNLTFIPPTGAQVQVRFTAKENGELDTANSVLRVRRIIANNLADEGLSFSCSYTQLLEGRDYVCTSSAFSVESGTVDVGLDLRDNRGNSANSSTSIALQVDTTGPAVTQMKGPLQQGDAFYSKGGDNVTVVFQEAGIGMYDGNAYIRIGLDASGVIRADSCALAGSAWECYFTIPTLSDGQYALEVDAQTNDDAGNAVTNTAATSLIIDTTPPVIGEIQYEGVNQLGKFDFASAGGKVIINFSASDSSPFTASVNFSTLGRPGSTTVDGSYNVKNTDCSGGICSTISDTIGSGGSVETVVVTATDILGNTASQTVDMRVLTVANQSNHWKGDVRLSPIAWDREVAELIAQKAIAEVTLTSPTQTNIITASFRECVNIENVTDLQGGNQYLSEMKYVAASDDQKVHYINLQSVEAFLPLNEILVECRFEVQSYGETELVPSEIVRVPVIIPLYNDPYDMPDEAIQKKIDNAVSDTKGYLKTIDKIYEWAMWLEKLCNLYNTIYSVIVALGTLLKVLGVTEKTMDGTIIGALFSTAVARAETAVCNGQTTVKEAVDHEYIQFIGRFCSWVACDISVFEMVGSDNPLAFTDTLGSGLESALGNTTGGSLAANNVDPWGSDSIITQAQNLCVVGMLRKFSDYRAIKCEYALCLIEQVEQGFVDESACETVKNTMECKFWYGEIWSLIPYSGLLDSIFTVWSMLERPHYSDVIQIVSWGCHALCNSPKYAGTVEQFCIKFMEFENLANAIATMAKIKDNFDQSLNFDKAKQSCDNMEAALKTLKENNKAFEDKVRQRTNVSGLTNTEGLQSVYNLPSGYGGSDGTSSATTGSDSSSGSTASSAGSGASSGSATTGSTTSTTGTSGGSSGTSSGSAGLPAGYGGDDGTTN